MTHFKLSYVCILYWKRYFNKDIHKNCNAETSFLYFFHYIHGFPDPNLQEFMKKFETLLINIVTEMFFNVSKEVSKLFTSYNDIFSKTFED